MFWQQIGIILMFILLLPKIGHASLPEGQLLPEIVLDGAAGGKVAGGAWDSRSVRGKIFVIFYVDPDVSDLNDHVSQAIKAKSLPTEEFESIAVINMKASWKPNFAINSRLEEKQKQYPRTTYVRDMNSALVDSWTMTDDSNNIILVDKDGKVQFSVDGKLSQAQLEDLLKKIDQLITNAHRHH